MPGAGPVKTCENRRNLSGSGSNKSEITEWRAKLWGRVTVFGDVGAFVAGVIGRRLCAARVRRALATPSQRLTLGFAGPVTKKTPRRRGGMRENHDHDTKVVTMRSDDADSDRRSTGL
jgi:hypothetical protein